MLRRHYSIGIGVGADTSMHKQDRLVSRVFDYRPTFTGIQVEIKGLVSSYTWRDNIIPRVGDM